MNSCYFLNILIFKILFKSSVGVSCMRQFYFLVGKITQVSFFPFLLSLAWILELISLSWKISFHSIRLLVSDEAILAFCFLTKSRSSLSAHRRHLLWHCHYLSLSPPQLTKRSNQISHIRIEQPNKWHWQKKKINHK